MHHRIRLAGPWEWQVIGSPQQSTREAARCQLPFTLSGDQRESGVVLTRRFHRPTGINDATTLRIVLQASRKPVDVQLNGKSLPGSESSVAAEYCFNLTGRVEPFNQLSVLLLPQTDASATLQSAWLEIWD